MDPCPSDPCQMSAVCTVMCLLVNLCSAFFHVSHQIEGVLMFSSFCARVSRRVVRKSITVMKDWCYTSLAPRLTPLFPSGACCRTSGFMHPYMHVFVAPHPAISVATGHHRLNRTEAWDWDWVPRNDAERVVPGVGLWRSFAF